MGHICGLRVNGRRWRPLRLAVFGENPRFLPRGKIGGFLATPAHDRLARPHRLGDLFFGVAGEPQFGSRYSAKTTDFGHVASFGSSFVRSLTVCRGAPTALAARDCGRCGGHADAGGEGPVRCKPVYTCPISRPRRQVLSRAPRAKATGRWRTAACSGDQPATPPKT